MRPGQKIAHQVLDVGYGQQMTELLHLLQSELLKYRNKRITYTMIIHAKPFGGRVRHLYQKSEILMKRVGLYQKNIEYVDVVMMKT